MTALDRQSRPCVRGSAGLLASILWAAAASAQDAPTARAPPSIELKRVWRTPLAGGTGSSLRVADLGTEGVSDVFVGAGRDGGWGRVVRLDGRTGKIIWSRKFRDEMYATPTMIDVNGDALADAIVGGRTQNLVALDGRTGETIWALRKNNPHLMLRNFNGALVIPDRDGDGVRDLLASQGGSLDDMRRKPGRFYLVSGATGAILVDHKTLDRRETYAIPAFDSKSGLLVVGTGGWSLPGHLFRLAFPSFEELWRFPSGPQGFISSPVLHDFGGDGVFDVVSVDFAGTTYRIDGASGEVKWSVSQPGFQTTASIALGSFGGDETLDVVVVTFKGPFPVFGGHSVVTWIDGRTGEVLATRTGQMHVQASPVTGDLDGDGLDETFVLSNSAPVGPKGKARLVVYDGRPGKAEIASRQLPGFSAATPHLSDIDGNGKLDLIIAYWSHVERLEITADPKARPTWNQFRGPRFDGVMRR